MVLQTPGASCSDRLTWIAVKKDSVAVFGPEAIHQRLAVLPRHRNQHAEDPGTSTEPPANGFDRAQQVTQPFKGERLRRHRDHQAVCRDQRVHADQGKTGRAVEHHQLVAGVQLLQRVLQGRLTPLDAAEREIRAGQLDRAGQYVEVRCRGGADGLLHREVVEQHAGRRRTQTAAANAAPYRGRRLTVEIDEQHAPARLRQRRSEVDGGRGLADPSLVVDHRDYQGQFFRHSIPNHTRRPARVCNGSARPPRRS